MHACIYPTDNPNLIQVNWHDWKLGGVFSESFKRYSFLDNSMPVEVRFYVFDEVFWISKNRSAYRLELIPEVCARTDWYEAGYDDQGIIRYTKTDRLVFHPLSDFERIFKYG